MLAEILFTEDDNIILACADGVDVAHASSVEFYHETGTFVLNFQDGQEMVDMELDAAYRDTVLDMATLLVADLNEKGEIATARKLPLIHVGG